MLRKNGGHIFDSGKVDGWSVVSSSRHQYLRENLRKEMFVYILVRVASVPYILLVLNILV